MLVSFSALQGAATLLAADRPIREEILRKPKAKKPRRKENDVSFCLSFFFFYEPNRMMKGPPTYIRTKSILCNFFSLSKIDEDECATANGGCDGTCTNRPGSFTCLCPVSFRMASNSKKCIGSYQLPGFNWKDPLSVIWPLL